MYIPHPSPELNELLARKPYQRVSPAKARFLFVGLDAKYAADIADQPIFGKVLDYHRDAVAFWLAHRVHHPFLLPEYSGGGRLYHASFAKIGFTPQHADQVSFIELLHVPTVGRNVLAPTDLAREHLDALNTAILSGSAQHIFLSATVARLMRMSGAFPWLSRSPPSSDWTLPVLYANHYRTVYSHLHFSTYGKFAQQKSARALAIHAIIDQTTCGRS